MFSLENRKDIKWEVVPLGNTPVTCFFSKQHDTVMFSFDLCLPVNTALFPN